MHSLVPAILLRLAGRDPLRQHAGLDYLTDSCDSPPAPREHKCGPLSGAQPMRKAELAKRPPPAPARHARYRLCAIAWQRSRYRLWASLSVSGSQHWPSPVMNQPLKSMHHTSLAAVHSANGALEGGLRRRSFRFRQSFAVEQGSDRARRRPLNSAQPFAQATLAPSPGPSLDAPPHLKTASGNLVRYRIGVMQRRPRRSPKPSTPAS